MYLGDCLDSIENGEIHDLVDYEYDGIQDILDYCEAILEYREDLEEAIDEDRRKNQNR